MNLDLTGLEGIAAMEAGGVETGQPLMLLLDDIVRDPEQPRTKFDPEKLRELAEGIKDRGVKSPISVRPANAEGKYMLNYGERRWLASRIAGKTHIPAIIDADFDPFDQVAENIDREDLTMVEIAEWIIKQIDEKGLKQAEVVRRIKRDKDFVSRHVKIGRAPREIREVADRCSDYTALAELASAYEKFPEQTQAFIAVEAEISRAKIMRLIEQCKNPLPEAADPAASAGQEPGQSAGTAGQGETSAGQFPAGDPPPAGSAGSGAKEANGEAAGKSATKVDKAATEKKTGSEGKAVSGSTAKPSDAETLLAGIYQAQVVEGVNIETVIQGLGDDDWLKVYRFLTREHKKGLEAQIEAFPSLLMQGLASGAYGHSGFRVYSTLAFIHGATIRQALDADGMQTVCFGSFNS